MPNQKKSKPFSATIGVSLSIACLVSIQAIAKTDPPTGNADASACNSLLLDRQVVQGTKNFKPEDLSIYNSDVKPILELADRLPEFGDALKKALKKKWRFGYDDFKNCPTEYSMYTSSTVKVACQTPDEVIVNPDWYEKLDGKSCHDMTNAHAIQALKQKQRDFFVHEMLLGITLGTPISTAASSVIFNDLTLQPLPSAEKLQADLEGSHFGIYKLGPRSSSLQETPPKEVSLEDILKGRSVAIKTIFNGHGIYAGLWSRGNPNAGDRSAQIADRICRKFGFSKALTATSEVLVSADDDAGDAIVRTVTLATYPDDNDGTILDGHYEIRSMCGYSGSGASCRYFEAPRVLKSVLCKKNADANDVLSANDQMSSPLAADRRMADLEGKPSRPSQGFAATQTGSASNNSAAM